jgi:hypothetical protein
VFTAILILFNLGLLGYSVSTITGIFSEGGFNKLLKDYRMHRSIQQLKNHVIICGFGRHALEVTYELSKQGKPFVVIETNHERIEQLKAEYESGQKMLADLETQESNLRTTMLRISGAIQVLEELLAKAEEEENLDDAKKVEVLSQ